MRAGIALGSNIEPRLEHLRTARLRLLEIHEGSEPALESKVYETSPVDCPPGSDSFLNAVMEIETSLPPSDLLVRLQDIEQAMGRPSAHTKNSPRSIDLDVLYCGNLTSTGARLRLPHPQFAQRRFVLAPLSDIRPDLVLPNFTKNIEQLLRACASVESLDVFKNTIY